MKPKTPPLIAVIGSDGSGKTTVCEHLILHVKKYGPAVRVHLGKQAGNVGRAVIKLPVLGGSFDKVIKKNKKSVRKCPGFLASIVVIFFVLRRLYRFRRMMSFRRRGMIVLTDRFPQIQIPGSNDGIVFPVNCAGHSFISLLAKLERRAFDWMTRQKPDLVIKLHVDLDVACARKPDHRPESLAKKIAIMPLLSFEGAKIVDIDANRPLAEVLSVAEKAISNLMESLGYHYADASSHSMAHLKS
ncbi:thymidylate kinase [Erwinia sorbitola]|uniref:Thymidylate kinase n=1 Tax=Erwinia sorbitola TaxID=2681984 RepID=A0ABW9R7S0_9GAMM|nr:thymidylate kinase [Erwinia sorbitola]MTD26195.1 thymidylate kinase [Erwinia sorbitola]